MTVSFLRCFNLTHTSTIIVATKLTNSSTLRANGTAIAIGSMFSDFDVGGEEEVTALDEEVTGVDDEVM